MKVKESLFLKEKKPLLKELLGKLLSEYSYASILACDAKGKAYRRSKTTTSIQEDDFCCDRGFVVKVYDNKGYGEYSFTEISEETVDEIVSKIGSSLMPLKDRIPEGVKESEYDRLPDEELVLDKSTECEIDPEEADDREIIEKLTKISEKGLKYDPKIIDCSVSCSYQRYSKMFLSKNRDMTQNILWTCAHVVALSKEEGSSEVQSCYRPVSLLGGLEVLDGLEAKLDDACKTAIELLDSESITPGEYECVCTPEVTGMIVHEAFGHGVEMDMFVKDRALAKKYLGEYVASPLITMRDGASTIDEVASYFFDDEGVPAQDT
ncbi:MAG: TldD/PmbA family protein, partial [Lachnospiraceae bacterium]|nr:TldD/PmbA family protein [Lachnospiraceae bacterium]